jgi:hypothetical protein
MDWIKDLLDSYYRKIRIKYFEWRLRKVYKEDTYVYEDDENFDVKN